MPRGIRRSEPAAPTFRWSGGVPDGTALGAPMPRHGDTATPLEVDPRDPQVIHGASNPGVRPGVYADTATGATTRTGAAPTTSADPFSLKPPHR